MLKEGDFAPQFTLPSNKGKDVSLSDYRGKKLILYFYPKDNSSVCTLQAKNFSESYKEFKKLNCEILAVSKDSLKSHDDFCSKNNLMICLASDENKDICEQYDVWDEKLMYGKTFLGIKRTTFLINEKGVIEKIWHDVKVENHVEEIINFLSEE